MPEIKTAQSADQNTEYTLTYAHQSAVVSPFGASLRRYFVMTNEGREWNAVWGYQGGANKRGGQGDVLIPFPGRIKGGTYSFEGTKHELVKNDKDGPNAIHGFLRATLFETKKVTSTEAVFTFELGSVQSIAGYPFALSVEVSYSIADDGLTTRFQITNRGSQSAPVGAGFHPYFCGDRGDLSEWNVQIPAKNFVELENVVPTGRILSVEGTVNDFRHGRLVGATRYNDCLAGLERDSSGWAEATVSSKGSSKGSSRRVSIRMDESFDYVVIYTGDQIAAPDGRKGFAIEPMTCAPDAFNHPDWGLRVLKPGESHGGTYVIKAE